jgi:hypothetical protein
MTLVRQSKDGWEYRLNHAEANCLRSLLNQFPLTADAAADISKTDREPQTADRQKLLEESLAGHRETLKKEAKSLLDAGKLKALGKEWRLRINSEEREMLLQILNDIRIGSWRTLGEPQNLELQDSNPSKREQVFHNIMNLAGYFEHKLLESQTFDN